MKKRPTILLFALGAISTLLACFLIFFFANTSAKNNIVKLMEKSYQSKDYRTAYLVSVSGAFQYPGDEKFLSWIQKCEESLASEDNPKLQNLDSAMQEILEFEKKYPVNEFREQSKTIRKLVSQSNGQASDKETASQLERLRLAVEKLEAQNYSSQFDRQSDDIKKLNLKIDDLTRVISSIKSFAPVQPISENIATNKDEKHEYQPVPNTDELVKQAVAAFYANDYSKAQDTCRKILLLDKSNPLANLISGAVLFARSPGDAKTRKKIIDYMKTALDRDPKLILAHLYLGQVYEIEGFYAGAIQDLKAYTSKEQKNDAAFFSLGRCYYQTGNYPEAIIAFQTVVAIKPGRSAGYFNLALCYDKQGKGDAALSNIEKAIEIDPQYYQALLAAADLYEKKTNWDRAIVLYKRALDLRSQAFISFRIGVCSKMADQPDNAAAYFRLAISQDSSFWDAYYELGLVYFETGKYKEAKETAVLLLEKNPNYEKKGDVNILLEKIENR